MKELDPSAERIVENARRLTEGRSKSELARKARIERTKLYRFLNGQQMLRADELQRLAAALDVEVTAFYGEAVSRLDFQSAFMKNDDFALRISGLLLGPEERYPVKDTSPIDQLLADVEPEPEAARIATDVDIVLRSPALSAFAFIGAWVLLWHRMSVDDGIQMARALRRIVPYHREIMVKAASIHYRHDRTHVDAVLAFLSDVEPEPLYLRGIEHVRYVLSVERIDQCAALAHRVLEKHRRRSQESVHRRLLAFKRTIDSPGAPEFWGKLFTYLDPNVP